MLARVHLGGKISHSMSMMMKLRHLNRETCNWFSLINMDNYSRIDINLDEDDENKVKCSSIVLSKDTKSELSNF